MHFVQFMCGLSRTLSFPIVEESLFRRKRPQTVKAGPLISFSWSA